MELPNEHNSYGFVYCTTNLVNGKKYIGRHKGRAKDSYIGSGKTLLKARKKYGSENFTRDILQYCISEIDIVESERYWGDYFNVDENEMFYNIIPCGNGDGKTNSPETIAKITKNNKSRENVESRRAQLKKVWERPGYRERQSESHKGIKHDSEDVKRRADKLRGIPRSQEVKDKISKTLRKRELSSPFKGKHHTQEAKNKISAKAMGRVAWNKGIVFGRL